LLDIFYKNFSLLYDFIFFEGGKNIVVGDVFITDNHGRRVNEQVKRTSINVHANNRDVDIAAFSTFAAREKNVSSEWHGQSQKSIWR
jgi:hypothetical protein